MQSLAELVKSLRRQTDAAEKKESYSLLLELFLSVEDGKCAGSGATGSMEATLKELFIEFEEFAAIDFISDLSHSRESHSAPNYSETILQIIALCFSNIDQWDSKAVSCLEAMFFAVCDTLIEINLDQVDCESNVAELVITSLFALDNSMPALTLKHWKHLSKVYNHVLKSANTNNLSRKYAYSAMSRFMSDIQLPSSKINHSEVVASLSMPISRDLTCLEFDVRQSAVLFLESVGLANAKAMGAISDDDMRNVLRFLSDHMTKLVNASRASTIEVSESEVACAASTWRFLVAKVPTDGLIPLLREGSTNRRTPGILLQLFNQIYVQDMLEGVKCWKCLVVSLNFITGWVNKPENVKVLKIILKLISSIVVKKKIILFPTSTANTDTTGHRREKTSLVGFKLETEVLDNIMDIMHLLVLASWPRPEQFYAFSYATSGNEKQDNKEPETVGQLLNHLSGNHIDVTFPCGCDVWTKDVNSSAFEAMHDCLILNRVVSLVTGGIGCLASSVMRSQMATTVSCPKSKDLSTCRSRMVSLFDWTWKSVENQDPAGDKTGCDDRLLNLSVLGNGCENVVSTSELTFLIENLSSSMIKLSEVHQNVYLSYKKKLGTCSGICRSKESDLEFKQSRHCHFQNEAVGHILSHIECVMRDVVGAWQWATYLFVSQLAKSGKLKSQSQTQSQSQSASQIYRTDDEDCNESTQGYHTADSQTEGPEISFTMNEDGDEEPVVVTQNDDISRMIRMILDHIIKVWKSVWCRSIGMSLPVCRELVLDSFLWLIHKTSTFGISVEGDDSNSDTTCRLTMQDIRSAVNDEFGATLLPDSMISAVLLLSLSHGLMVDTSKNSEFQTWSRSSGFAYSRMLWDMIHSPKDTGNSFHDICSLAPFALKNRILDTNQNVMAGVSHFKAGDSSIFYENGVCLHITIDVESTQEVNNCYRINRGFSRCFRGLIETFALPTLANWLGQVLFSSPFCNHRNSLKVEGGKRHSQDSSVPACRYPPNESSSCIKVTKNIRHGRCKDLENIYQMQEPTKHSLAILGAFVSAGVHYLASWKGNDDNCPPDLRRKIAHLVEPFLTFPLTWLSHYSSHNANLLVNSFAYQHLNDDETKVEVASSNGGNNAKVDGSINRTTSMKSKAIKQRTVSFNGQNVDLDRASSSLYRTLSNMSVGSESMRTTPNRPNSEVSDILDVDIALDNHEKFLNDWKFLFSVWLSVVNDGSELTGFIQSTNDCLWNMNISYLSSQVSTRQLSAPHVFHIDRFVTDTYVSFSFVNAVYECISWSNETEKSQSSDNEEEEDFGSLFGRDSHHRQNTVLTTPTRRLLLQEVGIRFVNILLSWISSVKELLITDQHLGAVGDSGSSIHALDKDFVISNSSVRGNYPYISVYFAKIDSCCSILQDEDVYLWFDYVFTLRETLRGMDIDLLPISSAGRPVGGPGMTPESSFPTENTSYLSPFCNNPPQKSSQMNISEPLNCTKRNGLIMSLDMCCSIILELKSTYFYLCQCSEGSSPDAECVRLSSLVSQKVTTLVNCFFEKLFHYMYDFNCKEYLELLNSSVHKFVTLFTNLSLDHKYSKKFTSDTDVNIDTVQQFLTEWDQKYTEHHQHSFAPRHLVGSELSFRQSEIEVTDLTTPTTPSPPPSPKDDKSEDRAGTEEMRVMEVSNEKQCSENSSSPQSKICNSSMIDNMIGDDENFPCFSGSLSALTTKLALPHKNIDIDNDVDSDDGKTNAAEEFEYEVVVLSPALGKRSLSPPSSPKSKSSSLLNSELIVTSDPIFTTHELGSPNANKKHKLGDDCDILDITIGGEENKSTPAVDPEGTQLSLSDNVSLTSLRECEDFLRRSEKLIHSGQMNIATLEGETTIATRSEARRLLSSNTMLVLQIAQKLVKLQQSIDE